MTERQFAAVVMVAMLYGIVRGYFDFRHALHLQSRMWLVHGVLAIVWGAVFGSALFRVIHA